MHSLLCDQKIDPGFEELLCSFLHEFLLYCQSELQRKKHFQSVMQSTTISTVYQSKIEIFITFWVN
jgi:hypothetical protein